MLSVHQQFFRVPKIVFYYLTVYLLASSASPCPKSKPHIVFILADDLGWADVSFHGSSQIPTPNLDALAADGVVLNNYYVQPYCTPSRAALMTGLYPIRTGMQGMPIGAAQPWGVVRERTTYASVPQETWWHLGYYKQRMTPTYRGFDSFYGFLNGGEDYYTHNLTFVPMVDAMDQSVGQVVKALSDAGMLENTVIAFSSDNGGGPYGTYNSRGFNWPLRGAKGTVWEGGTRAAAFVWSPLLSWRRRVSNELMHITDWLPTFYSIAGGNAAKIELDGYDMWRQLSHGARSPRAELLYNYDYTFSNAAALRNSRYKLVLDDTRYLNDRYAIAGGSNPCRDIDSLLDHSTVAGVLRHLYRNKRLPFSTNWRNRATLGCGRAKTNFSPDSGVYLFDIVNDPCELNNLASALPSVVASLKKRIDVYRAAAVPTRNILTVDPDAFPENHNGVWAPWAKS
ncbi:hypothetical protein MTO96_022634 [Rhipicephalus appendiculatus]